MRRNGRSATDWRRTEQRYEERSLDASGQVVLQGGDVYGIPKSRMDDCGLLTDVLLPLSERITLNAGGRLDYCWTALDTSDPVITQFSDPTQYYYDAGFAEPHDLLGMAYLTAKIKLDQQWTFNAGTAYAMRMPDLAELYDDYPFVPIANVGNSNPGGLSTLVPEKDFQFDVGLKSVEKQVSYGVRVFARSSTTTSCRCRPMSRRPCRRPTRPMCSRAISARSPPRNAPISIPTERRTAARTPTRTRRFTSMRTSNWQHWPAAICSRKSGSSTGSPCTATWPTCAARIGIPWSG